MNDLIRSAIGYALVMALIIGGAKLYKAQTKVVIDPNDQSMRAEEYPYGGHSLKTNILKVSEFQQGDVVAYYHPFKPAVERVGRIVAIEGQVVEGVALKNIKVNGLSTTFRIDHKDWNVPEIKVPRGCVFIMHDKPTMGEDSLQVGPIPYYNIKGKLN